MEDLYNGAAGSVSFPCNFSDSSLKEKMKVNRKDVKSPNILLGLLNLTICWVWQKKKGQ